MNRVRKRITYANVVATLALFLALGGVGYAAVKLPKNSVGTKQLKRGAVTEQKISRAARKSFSEPGPVGPAGPAGPKGDAGAPGSALGYAFVDGDGNLDPSRSKGVVGVSGLCSYADESQCSAPTPPEGIKELCFKLEFTPHVIVATPQYGRSYAPDEATVVNAKIPARAWSGNYGGCPSGYSDAELRAYREDSSGVYGGIYVMFN